jgi:hypothetical protein
MDGRIPYLLPNKNAAIFCVLSPRVPSLVVAAL